MHSPTWDQRPAQSADPDGATRFGKVAMHSPTWEQQPARLADPDSAMRPRSSVRSLHCQAGSTRQLGSDERGTSPFANARRAARKGYLPDATQPSWGPIGGYERGLRARTSL